MGSFNFKRDWGRKGIPDFQTVTAKKSAVLSPDEARQIVAQAAATLNLTGKRVLTIIPDGTRTMPMPLMFKLLQEEIGARAAACDYLVALGTHPQMSEAQLNRLMGRACRQRNVRQGSGLQSPLGPS